MINKINEFLGEKIFSEDDSENLEYLKKFDNKGHEHIKIQALKGDKLLDFFLYQHMIDIENIYTKGELDNQRKKYSSNNSLINLFDKFDFDYTQFNYNINNPFGEKNKSAFIEALIYEIFRKKPDYVNLMLNIILNK